MGAGAFRVARRGRARLVAVACTAVIVVAGMAQIWPAGATSGPDTNISDYVLYAYDHISLKGGGSGETTNLGGSVGVRNADSDPTKDPDSLHACDGGGTHNVFVANGFNVVADTMSADADCSFPDVYVNTVHGVDPVIRGSKSTWTPPLPMSIPSPGAFSCAGGTNLSVPKNNSQTVNPGTYGNVTFGQGTNIQLSAGVYVMCNLQISSNAVVHTVPGVDIRVANQVNVDDGATFGTACDATVYARGDDNPANTINFGENAEVWGTWKAPNGEMALGRKTNLHGRFWGFSIHDDFSMNATLCASDSATTTTSTTGTTVDNASSSSSSSSSTSTSSTTDTTVDNSSSSTSTSSTSTSTSTISESTTIVTDGTTATTSTTSSTSSTSSTTIPVTVTTLGGHDTTTTSTTVPSTVTTEGGLQATTTTTAKQSMPFTGSSEFPPIAGALSLLAGGALLLVSRRRNARRA